VSLSASNPSKWLIIAEELDWLIGYLETRDDDYTAEALRRAREVRILVSEEL
jgi:hypothetical protein